MTFLIPNIYFYDTQISWSNIFCQFPLNFFDFNNILISIKKDAEHISVNNVRATLLRVC